jgi:hypothetical protein
VWRNHQWHVAGFAMFPDMRPARPHAMPVHDDIPLSAALLLQRGRGAPSPAKKPRDGVHLMLKWSRRGADHHEHLGPYQTLRRACTGRPPQLGPPDSLPRGTTAIRKRSLA